MTQENRNDYQLPVSENDYNQFEKEANKYLKEIYCREEPNYNNPFRDEFNDIWTKQLMRPPTRKLYWRAFFYQKLYQQNFLQRIIIWIRGPLDLYLDDYYQNINYIQQIQQIALELKEAKGDSIPQSQLHEGDIKPLNSILISYEEDLAKQPPQQLEIIYTDDRNRPYLNKWNNIKQQLNNLIKTKLEREDKFR